MIKLTLPFVTESNNKLIRFHWTARRKLQVGYMDYLLVAVNESDYCSRELLAEGKRECHIISYRTRRLDYDNLVGGMGPLINCLVSYKLLKDDSPANVNMIIEQKKSLCPKTVIILKDTEE